MNICRSIQFYTSIRLFKYLKLNYLTKKVDRSGKGRIVPYKGAVIDLEHNAKIVVGDKDILVGANRLKGSKTETFIRLRENAVWTARGGCEISYGSTVEVLKNASITSGYFTMNSFSTIIAAKSIALGEDIMISRNVVIYDSDFHKLERENQMIKKSCPVIIKDHVWLGYGSIVLKGVTIGENSMVSAGTIVTYDISKGTMVSGNTEQKVLRDSIKWER